MRIGDLKIENNVFLAPMAGVTDMAFRTICKHMGAGLVYTEMVSAKGLFYKDEKTHILTETCDEERPIAIQIFGSDPDIMANIVEEKLNNRLDIDIIDINMGCPTPKIVKNGDGSALLKNPSLIRNILKSVVGVSKKPVTIKIRKGWNENSINAIEISQIAEEEGVSAIVVHGRTREEFYSGEADWEIIKDVKNNVSIPVIGNGDIFSAQDALDMIEYTNCDAVMIGRGCRGNPWIIKETLKLLKEGKNISPPNYEDRINMALNHLELLIKLKGEKIAIREMRKHIAWYVKGMPNSANLRNKLNSIEEEKELKKELFNYLENIK
jgi:tRNA-dihydrouridine synthase B